VAELDDGDGLLDDGDSGGGVMHVFLRAFQGRLKSELAGNEEERVLLNHLADNEWCLGAVHAPEMCSLFGIALAEPSYYRDIHVWLPDVRWGAMPVCPVCESSKDVSSHCFRTNHVGRRIVDVDTTYYVLVRWYNCRACEKTAKTVRAAAAAAPARNTPFTAAAPPVAAAAGLGLAAAAPIAAAAAPVAVAEPTPRRRAKQFGHDEYRYST